MFRTIRRVSLISTLLGVAGLGLILTGTFMPWVRSGSNWRSSYEVVKTADRLGLVSGGFQRWLAGAWYFVPLLCGVALVALALQLRRLWRLLLFLLTLPVGLLAASVWASDLPSGNGPAVTVAGAASLLAALAYSLLRA